MSATTGPSGWSNDPMNCAACWMNTQVGTSLILHSYIHEYITYKHINIYKKTFMELKLTRKSSYLSFHTNITQCIRTYGELDRTYAWQSLTYAENGPRSSANARASLYRTYFRIPSLSCMYLLVATRQFHPYIYTLTSRNGYSNDMGMYVCIINFTIFVLRYLYVFAPVWKEFCCYYKWIRHQCHARSGRPPHPRTPLCQHISVLEKRAEKWKNGGVVWPIFSFQVF